MVMKYQYSSLSHAYILTYNIIVEPYLYYYFALVCTMWGGRLEDRPGHLDSYRGLFCYRLMLISLDVGCGVKGK